MYYLSPWSLDFNICLNIYLFHVMLTAGLKATHSMHARQNGGMRLQRNPGTLGGCGARCSGLVSVKFAAIFSTTR